MTSLSFQLLGHVRLFVTLWIAARQSSLSLRTCSNSCPLIWWYHSTTLSSITPFYSCPSIFPSIWVFSSESEFCIRWPKYWSFSISAFSEYSGLISFRIVWFDLLVDQGTLESLIQHHRSKASILEKQRHCFAKNGLCSQSYDFSGGLVWMWELDHKEDWASNNWCFWTVALEKTLKSPLDRKEIIPVNSKGNKPWIFIRRTDDEAELSILWPPDVKNWLIEKDLDAGKDWRKEKVATEDRYLDGIADSMDVSLNKLREIVKYREAWHISVHGVTKSQTQFSHWTTVKIL